MSFKNSENWLVWRLKSLAVIIFGFAFVAGLLKIIYKYIRYTFFLVFFSLIFLSQTSFASNICSYTGRVSFLYTSLPVLDSDFGASVKPSDFVETSSSDLVQIAAAYYCGDHICTPTYTSKGKTYYEDVQTCPQDCAVCGDGWCTASVGETVANCSDCGFCGDGLCAFYESLSSCPFDCKICGDLICSPYETFSSCPNDCDTCGNGYCGVQESVASCPADCAVCGDAICSSAESYSSCPADCAKPICGDGVCGKEESFTSCFLDCDTCGNGYCGYNESITSCSVDCPLSDWLMYKDKVSAYPQPASIAVDVGYIYVGHRYHLINDKAPCAVYIYSNLSPYSLLSSFGSCGTGDGQFQSTQVVAVDESKIYVGDTDNFGNSARVQVFDKSTHQFLGKFGHGLYDGVDDYSVRPFDMAVDSKYIYLSHGKYPVTVYDKNSYQLVGGFGSCSETSCLSSPAFDPFAIDDLKLYKSGSADGSGLVNIYDKSTRKLVGSFVAKDMAGNAIGVFGGIVVDSTYIFIADGNVSQVGSSAVYVYKKSSPYNLVAHFASYKSYPNTLLDGENYGWIWLYSYLTKIYVSDVFAHRITIYDNYHPADPPPYNPMDVVLDFYGFTGSLFGSSSFTSPLAVSSDTSDLTPISGGSGSGTLGTGVGSLGGSGSLGSGVGTIGNSSVLGNFNIGSSVGLGSGVGSVQASNQSAYTNIDYSVGCDCKQVFNDFITSVKGGSLFSVISFSNLSTGSSGSSVVSIPPTTYGGFTLDLAEYASIYPYIAALLLLLASLVSVKIIALPKDVDQ